MWTSVVGPRTAWRIQVRPPADAATGGVPDGCLVGPGHGIGNDGSLLRRGCLRQLGSRPQTDVADRAASSNEVRGLSGGGITSIGWIWPARADVSDLLLSRTRRSSGHRSNWWLVHLRIPIVASMPVPAAWPASAITPAPLRARQSLARPDAVAAVRPARTCVRALIRMHGTIVIHTFGLHRPTEAPPNGRRTRTTVPPCPPPAQPACAASPSCRHHRKVGGGAATPARRSRVRSRRKRAPECTWPSARARASIVLISPASSCALPSRPHASQRVKREMAFRSIASSASSTSRKAVSDMPSAVSRWRAPPRKQLPPSTIGIALARHAARSRSTAGARDQHCSCVRDPLWPSAAAGRSPAGSVPDAARNTRNRHGHRICRRSPHATGVVTCRAAICVTTIRQPACPNRQRAAVGAWLPRLARARHVSLDRASNAPMSR